MQAAERYGTPQVLYTFRESHQVRRLCMLAMAIASLYGNCVTAITLRQ